MSRPDGREVRKPASHPIVLRWRYAQPRNIPEKAKAHIAGAVAEARIAVQRAVEADLDRRIARIDSAVDRATSQARTSSATGLAAQRRKPRRKWST
jgi:hypothetical protein